MLQALLLVASAAWGQLEADDAVPLQTLLPLVSAAVSRAAVEMPCVRAVAQMLYALAHPEPAVEVAGQTV
jgi:hypothetical protein